jgi:hypothetical protein
MILGTRKHGHRAQCEEFSAGSLKSHSGSEKEWTNSLDWFGLETAESLRDRVIFEKEFLTGLRSNGNFDLTFVSLISATDKSNKAETD